MGWRTLHRCTAVARYDSRPGKMCLYLMSLTSTLPALHQAIDKLGLPGSADPSLECTGGVRRAAAGCSASATNTTRHASSSPAPWTQQGRLDQPVNMHFSGCPKSCAQHYPSDIALLGTTVQHGDTTVEGYHIYVGAGEQSFGRALYDAVPAADIPALMTRLLQVYRDHRHTP